MTNIATIPGLVIDNSRLVEIGKALEAERKAQKSQAKP